MNIDQIIKNRRSIRKFKDIAVPKEIITSLIEAAQSAPSASNSQPWCFYVLQDSKRIMQLKTLVSNATSDITNSIDERFKKQFQDYSHFFTSFHQAPCLIIPVYREYNFLTQTLKNDTTESEKKRILKLESNSALASTAMAVQNLMLSAQSKELGTTCMTGPILAEQNIKKNLKIPEKWTIACFIAVGYPDETPAPPKKRSMERVIKWI
jgi:nitroreductase